jgi:hypothetical protein
MSTLALVYKFEQVTLHIRCAKPSPGHVDQVKFQAQSRRQPIYVETLSSARRIIIKKLSLN